MWYDRNKWCFEGKKNDHAIIIAKAVSSLQNYQKASGTLGESRAPRREVLQADPVKWKQPLEGSYKLNMDASHADGYVWRIGAIIRNNRGEVMANDLWTGIMVLNCSCGCGHGCKCIAMWKITRKCTRNGRNCCCDVVGDCNLKPWTGY